MGSQKGSGGRHVYNAYQRIIIQKGIYVFI